jgi:hypothetical protein
MRRPHQAPPISLKSVHDAYLPSKVSTVNYYRRRIGLLPSQTVAGANSYHGTSSAPEDRAADVAERASEDAWFAHVKILASDELKGRLTGTPDLLRTAYRVEESVDRLGLPSLGLRNRLTRMGLARGCEGWTLVFCPRFPGGSVFVLCRTESLIEFYWDSEPTYQTVHADVLKSLSYKYVVPLYRRGNDPNCRNEDGTGSSG